MKKLLNRFKEPSTWAALAALSVLFGVPPQTAQTVVTAVGVIADAANALGITPEAAATAVQAAPAAIAGAVAILLPERTGAPANGPDA